MAKMSKMWSVSYWAKVARVFKRYGIELKEMEKPYETKVQLLLNRWIENLEIPRTKTYGVGAPDSVIHVANTVIAVEVKGHNESHHDLMKIMAQFRRYLKASQLILFITHSYGLRSQVESVVAVSDIWDRVLCLAVTELPRSKEELEELVRLFLELCHEEREERGKSG